MINYFYYLYISIYYVFLRIIRLISELGPFTILYINIIFLYFVVYQTCQCSTDC